jgi:response regulator of citrate/malate metabolism
MSTSLATDEEPLKVLFVDDEVLEFRIHKKRITETDGLSIDLDFAQTIEAAVEKVKANSYQLIFMDNRLFPNNDFRETVPALRSAGYVGPVGVVSNDITEPYFQQFPDYGVDFRIGKDEIDAQSIRHIVEEYVFNDIPEEWNEDLNT